MKTRFCCRRKRFSLQGRFKKVILNLFDLSVEVRGTHKWTFQAFRWNQRSLVQIIYKAPAPSVANVHYGGNFYRLFMCNSKAQLFLASWELFHV